MFWRRQGNFHTRFPCTWPIHLYTTRYSRPVPLLEKQTQNIMFPPPCLMVGMVFLESKSAFFPPNTTSRVDAKKFNFSFIWPQHFLQTLHWIIQVLICKLQTDLYMCLLAGTTWFQSTMTQCITNDHSGNCGPLCLEIINKLLPHSSGLFPHLSPHQVYSTLGDLALSSREKEIDSQLIFLPSSYRTSSWLPLA